jgi:hypothetical protein
MKVAGCAEAARGCPGGANARPRTATRLHSGPSNRPRRGANHEFKGNRSAKRVGRQHRSIIEVENMLATFTLLLL